LRLGDGDITEKGRDITEKGTNKVDIGLIGGSGEIEIMKIVSIPPPTRLLRIEVPRCLHGDDIQTLPFLHWHQYTG
jgi:hypothetical protein